MNNLRTSPLSSCKNLPPYFFMVHLLHRLYGVDAPGRPDASPRSRVGSTGDEIVPKIIINDTINFFLLNCNQHFGNVKP